MDIRNLIPIKISKENPCLEIDYSEFLPNTGITYTDKEIKDMYQNNLIELMHRLEDSNRYIPVDNDLIDRITRELISFRNSFLSIFIDYVEDGDITLDVDSITGVLLFNCKVMTKKEKQEKEELYTRLSEQTESMSERVTKDILAVMDRHVNVSPEVKELLRKSINNELKNYFY